MFASRESLSYEKYCKFHDFSLPQTDQPFQVEQFSTGDYIFTGLDQHKRQYETV